MSNRSDQSWSRRRVLQAASGAVTGSLLARPSEALAAAPVDWPCFRGPNRNGVLSERITLLPGGPKKLWSTQVGSGHASSAIVGGRLYTLGGGRSEQLLCLDARTGNKIWGQPVDLHSCKATPAVEGGRVYVLASKDVWPPNSIAFAHCFDAATGKEIWKRDLPPPAGVREYGHAGSPLVWEDLVIFNAGGGVALRKSTGQAAWSHAGLAGLATPVLFQRQGRPAVAIFGGNALLARDARSGQALWSIPWATELAVNACDPLFFDNKVFICSNYGRGRALYDVAAQPRKIWEFGERSGHAFSSGLVHQGQLYCFTDTKFVCLDPLNGQPRWEAEGGGSVLLIGNQLVRVREQGDLSIAPVSTAGFRPAATINVGMREVKSVPAYWDGKLYVRNEQGQLACFQIGSAS